MRKLFIIILSVILINIKAVAVEVGVVNLRETAKAFSNIAKLASPAVVFIQVESYSSANIRQAQELPPIIEEFFKRYGEPLPPHNGLAISHGSGFIISEDGYIVTNNHIIQGASSITVLTHEGKEYRARLIGSDVEADVAVVQIEGSNFPKLQFGDSDKIEVGEWVVALGNPAGLSHSLSAGIVSAKGRSQLGIVDYENFIQTDAAINRGNSGGPLLDLDAKVVGINTAVLVTKEGGNMGIGFSIPINMAKQIVDQLIKNGKVVRGFMGVRIQSLTSALAKSFNMPDNKGVLIAFVEPNSPAAQAGLMQGDIIVELNGVKIEKTHNFRNTIALSAPGSSHKIKVIRDGKLQTFTVKLTTIPAKNLAEPEPLMPSRMEKIGIIINEINDALALDYNLTSTAGVVITKVAPGSVAELAGLTVGSCIIKVNDMSTNTSSQFHQGFNQATKAGYLRLLVTDEMGQRYVGITLD